MAAPNFDQALKTVTDQYDENLQLTERQHAVFEKLWNGEKSIIVSLKCLGGKDVVQHLCGKLLSLKRAKRRSDEAAYVTVIVDTPNTGVPAEGRLSRFHEKKIAAVQVDDYKRARYSDGMQERMDDTSIADIEAGKYEIVILHPEALLGSDYGRALLNSRKFCDAVVALVIDDYPALSRWGEDSRSAFKKLATLPTYFSCPIIAFTPTLTPETLTKLPTHLGLEKTSCVAEVPVKSNVFLGRERKQENMNTSESVKAIYMPELDRLKAEGSAYPVTLCYMPLEWCVGAQKYATRVFGEPDLYTTLYAIFFSTQDTTVLAHIVEQLKMAEPRIRLVFCAFSTHLGFDSPSITRVIHAKPPPSVVTFAQQISVAGTQGQPTSSLVYFNPSDLIPKTGIDEHMREFCLSESCLRLVLRKVFGFGESELMHTCKCCCVCAKSCKCELCQ